VGILCSLFIHMVIPVWPHQDERSKSAGAAARANCSPARDKDGNPVMSRKPVYSPATSSSVATPRTASRASPATPPPRPVSPRDSSQALVVPGAPRKPARKNNKKTTPP